jgi:hypothetical protein
MLYPPELREHAANQGYLWVESTTSYEGLISCRENGFAANLSLGGGRCNAILPVMTTKGMMDGIVRFRAPYVF